MTTKNSSVNREKPEILTVDDTPASLKLIVEILQVEGYKVRPAPNAEAALAAIKAKIPELILLDIRMPGMDGFELMQKLQSDERTKDIPVIFLSASVDVESHIKGFELGAVDFVDKPFQQAELLARVRTHIELYHLRNRMQKEVEQRTLELKQSQQQLKSALKGFIEAISKAVEARDPYTAGHQRRVAELAAAIAREMKLDEAYIEGIHMGGAIHDIGKIKLPAEILTKPATLSATEYEMVKEHSRIGYEIVQGVDFPWPVANIAYQHHERWDGSGYPQGLKGEEICREARIIAVADVVEAMATHRPYRAALSMDEALKELQKGRGTLFEPEVVDACLQLFKSGKYTLKT